MLRLPPNSEITARTARVVVSLPLPYGVYVDADMDIDIKVNVLTVDAGIDVDNNVDVSATAYVSLLSGCRSGLFRRLLSTAGSTSTQWRTTAARPSSRSRLPET